MFIRRRIKYWKTEHCICEIWRWRGAVFAWPVEKTANSKHFRKITFAANSFILGFLLRNVSTEYCLWSHMDAMICFTFAVNSLRKGARRARLPTLTLCNPTKIILENLMCHRNWRFQFTHQCSSRMPPVQWFYRLEFFKTCRPLCL